MTAARSPYGDLADDIALLATDGKVIRRHDGMYRLNGATEKLTAAMVRGLAAEVRNRRMAARSAAKPDAPRARMASHEITKTREGTPSGDGAGTLCEGQVGSTVAKTCTKCGGPRSKESKGLCAGCYTPKGWPGNPKAEARNPFGAHCRCGQLRSHGGRCWARRGLDGPASGKRKPWKAPPLVCECGGPRYRGALLCSACYRKSKKPQHARQDDEIAALKAEVAELKAAVDRMRAHLAMDVGR